MSEPTPAARVTRTGLALVHEGELVLPAAGSEAQAQRVIDDSRAVITYLFPVEIEVRAAGAVIHEGRIADLALDKLTRCLHGLG